MAAEETTREHAGRRRLPRPGRRQRDRNRRQRGVVGRRDPRLPYPVAAAAVGLLVTIAGRALIFGGAQACDAVRGTSNCGTAGGFMLLAIALLMVYLGMRLLRLLAVPEPGVTSVLGVALLTVVLLAVLVDYIFSVWMWVVLPLLGAVLYAFSAWAAARLAEVGKNG